MPNTTAPEINLWAKIVGPANSQSSVNNDISLDGSNNVYITGSFSGTADFHPSSTSPTLNSSSGAAYVCKYNSSGNYVWTKQVRGQNGTTFSTNAVSGSASGAITITATVSGVCGVVAVKPSVWVGKLKFLNPTVDDDPYYPGSCHGVCPGYHWAEIQVQGISPNDLDWTLSPGGTVNWQWEPLNNQIVFEVVPFYTTFPFYFIPEANECGQSSFQFCFISGPNCGMFRYAFSPNPADEELLVFRTDTLLSGESPVEWEISFFNSSQERLYSVKNSKSIVHIPIAAYPEGQYYLQVLNQDGMKREQILIKR